MLAEILAAAGRTIAELVGAVIVPPGALVVGGAVEDLEMDVGMLEPDAAQLHQIFRLQPDRQPAVIERHVAEIADPQAGHAEPVLVGIERADRLAEHLADAVAAVRPRRDVGADPVMARIEADRMVRRGEHHALDALLPRRLEQIVAADDVGLQDLVPGAFDRIAAEMQDAVDAFADRLDLRQVGEIGRLEFLVLRRDRPASSGRSAAGPDRSAAAVCAGSCRFRRRRRSSICVAFRSLVSRDRFAVVGRQ